MVSSGGILRRGRRRGSLLGRSARESRFRHLHPWSVEILLQTGIELGQATVLEVGDTLLLVLDITSGSEFVSGHGDDEPWRAVARKGGAARGLVGRDTWK